MRTTELNGIIDLPTKTILLSNQIAIREQVNIRFIGYGSAVASDLILAIVYDGLLVGLLQPMVDGGGYLSGVLDLNTLEIVTVFEGLAANAKKKMSIVVWDTTNQCTLVNDFIWVQQNPYDSSMDATTPVPPIGNVLYVPLATYNAQIAVMLATLIKQNTPGANFRISGDGLNFEWYDPVLLTWDAWGPYNGAWSKL